MNAASFDHLVGMGMQRRRHGKAVVGAALIAVMVMIAGSAATNDHATHHANYQSWVNRNNEGCCNNQDCRPLEAAHERMNGRQVEVLIEGTWCQIEPRHYLLKGNVPDASTAHVCVWHEYSKPGRGPCERLLCFQPRPLF